MRVSRAPERRGGTNKSMMYFALVIAALVVGVLVTYLATGFGFSAAKGDQTATPDTVAAPVAPVNLGFAALPPLATPVPTAVPNPAAAAGGEAAKVESNALPNFVPDVKFGEVLSQGFVKLNLPAAKGVDSWYTYEVDTATREITLFFAIYNDSGDDLVRTVKVEGYSQGQVLTNAEITVFYPNGPERVLQFDGSQGTMTVTQQYAKPAGPSLFSPELRVALVNYGIALQNADGTIQTQLNLDISGLSDTEGMLLRQSAPGLVTSVLTELQLLVDQIESLRVK